MPEARSSARHWDAQRGKDQQLTRPFYPNPLHYTLESTCELDPCHLHPVSETPPPKGILGQLLSYHLPKGWPKYSLGGSLSESLQISLNRVKPGTHAGQCAAGVLSVHVPCVHPTPKFSVQSCIHTMFLSASFMESGSWRHPQW